MDELMLIRPTLKHKRMAEEFKQEFFDYGETVINGSALFDQMDYLEWLDNIKRNQNHETVRADWVVSDTFFVIRKSDKKIIGIIDIRHNLGNTFLSAYGGHIGYSVRPRERKSGYATYMLGQGLKYAKNLGLLRVMLGCYADNLASRKTIEKYGGVLTEEKTYIDGKPMLIYWVTL